MFMNYSLYMLLTCVFHRDILISIRRLKILKQLDITDYKFFFLHVHKRVGGGGIQTCDLRFIRRGSQPIELSLEDDIIGY